MANKSKMENIAAPNTLPPKTQYYNIEIVWSHTAWAPEGRERQSQADPMGPKPVGVRGRVGLGVRGPGPGERNRSRGPTGP